MRKVIDLNEGWRLSRSNNADENTFEKSSAEVSFPVCDSLSDTNYIMRKSVKMPSEGSSGSVYLCFSGFYGECELFIDKKRRYKRSCAGGDISFDVTGLVFPGEEATFTLLAVSLNGCFAVSGVRLIIMSKSHFCPLDGTECGIIVRAEKSNGTVRIHAIQKVINPINYDIASYIVTDSSGRMLGSAASKPSQGDVTIELSHVPLWNGPHDAASLMLTASILRDSTVLDSVQLRFGIRFPERGSDGFFHLNGERMPISGMSLSAEQLQSVPVSRLMSLANELGANSFKLPAVPQSLPLVEACDRGGFAVWIDIPKAVTGEVLQSCVRRYSEHPSVLFIGYSGEDNGVSEKERNTLFENIIGVDIDSGEYGYVSDMQAAASFAAGITPATPGVACAATNDTDTHEKIWAELCSKAGMYAYYTQGLFSYERKSVPGIPDCEPTDAFYFYKSCFSSVPFVKIIPCEPSGKYADIKCCSNESSLSLTVNGRGRKKYTGTLTKGGLVVFGSVFLPSKENIVKVTGEKSSDEAEIIVNRKKI